MAPGMYELWHCDDPCTTTLGDLTWGVFWIGPVGEQVPVSPNALPPSTIEETPSTTTTTTSPTSTTVPPPSTTNTSPGSAAPEVSSSWMPLVAGGVGLAVAGGTTALLVRKRDDPKE